MMKRFTHLWRANNAIGRVLQQRLGASSFENAESTAGTLADTEAAVQVSNKQCRS